MAKNKCEMKIMLRNTAVTSKPGTFGTTIKKHWTEFADALSKEVIMYGGNAAKKACDELLQLATERIPVGTNEHSAKLHDSADLSDIRTEGKGKNREHYVQVRNAKGQFGKKVTLEQHNDGSFSIPHTTGALKESGYVQHYKQRERDGGKTGYRVVFDTRKVDARSAMNNFNYAYIVHEDGYPSAKKEHHGKFFLKIPYEQNKQKWLNDIAEECKKALERRRRR